LIGIFIYAVVFPLVFFPLGFNQLRPELSWILATLMLLISSLRLVLNVYFDSFYKKNTQLCMLLFKSFSLGHAVVLGVYFAIVMYDEALQTLSLGTFIAMGGISSGAIMALTPRIKFALLNLATLVIPSICVALLYKQNYAISFMIIVYSMYIALIGIRTNKEYLRAFGIESELNQQRHELEELNKIDPLTHIFNRGHFNTTYDLLWYQAIRHNKPISLLLIDIDHFKSINDNYGHLFGDKALKHVAQIIDHAAQRKTDLVCRFGGEEFAMLLVDTELGYAGEIAEKVRMGIQQTVFKTQYVSLNITASIGVATMLPVRGDNANMLIEMADVALYQAKSEGRNLVCIHPKRQKD
jgi:diguanylate cyclase (GGDEF)-like protein